MDIIDKIITFLKEQPEIAALLSIGATGGLVIAMKNLPRQVLKWLVHTSTTVVTIHNNQPIYDYITEWLSTLNYVGRSRSLRLIGSGRIAPGFARHWIWFRGALIFVNLVDEDRENQGGQSVTRRHKLVITTLGRSHCKIQQILEEVANLDRNSYIKVHVYGDSWRVAQLKQKRDFNSLFLPIQIKQQIIRSVVNFRESRKSYTKLNIPYRFGMLLSGPPGTGKTTSAFAIASLLSWPIYYVSLSSIASDSRLLEALSSVGEKSVVLIEDVDAFRATASRKSERLSLDHDFVSEISKCEEMLDPLLTLSGLLNTIDGVVAPEGRILVLTTNHPDKLDPALIRKGRVDMHIELGTLQPEQVVDMYRLWFPDGDGMETIYASAKQKARVPADWQDLFLTYQEHHTELMQMLQDTMKIQEFTRLG